MYGSIAVLLIMSAGLTPHPTVGVPVCAAETEPTSSKTVAEDRAIADQTEGSGKGDCVAEDSVVARLSRRLQLQLLAVTEHIVDEPDRTKQWWKASGAATDPEYDFVKGPLIQDAFARQFVFAVAGDSAETSEVVVVGSGGENIARRVPIVDDKVVEGLTVYRISWDRGPQSKSTWVHVAVVVEPWSVVARARRGGGGRSHRRVVLGSMMSSEDGVLLSVADRLANSRVRAVAVMKDGRVLEGRRLDGGRSGDLSKDPHEYVRLTTVCFDAVSMEDIEETRFEVRPQYVVEFRDVSLYPGHKTKPSVRIIERPEATGSGPQTTGDEKALMGLPGALYGEEGFPMMMEMIPITPGPPVLSPGAKWSKK
jgi:hypothetical protein